MAAYQRGDAAAFGELVLRYERPLWAFLRRFVHEDTTAEDLLQEVFLRVVRAAGDWKSDAKLSTWLYTIARNLCTDQARRAIHRTSVSLDGPAHASSGDDSGPAVIDQLAASSDAGRQAEHAAMNRQLGDHLNRAIDALPPEQREVFLMRELLDMPFADIAQAVGATEPTVKSRMRYALEKLRQALVGFHDAPARSGLEGGG